MISLLLGGCLAIDLDLSAQIPYQVVPLTAEVSATPPSITVKWPMDLSAPFYKVSRKAPEEFEWHELATLEGNAVEYQDLDVVVGDVWEYAVIRSAPLTVMDTLCVAAGNMVTFTIFDTGGNGLCCWNSDGFWELYACGELLARGARYEFQDQFQFTMCGSDNCEEVVIVIYPDHQFEEISWELVDYLGMEIGSGYPDMAPRFGYVLSGVAPPPVEQQGTILLLVDQQHAASLSFELERLHLDLLGEGWLVLREDVAASAAVTEVKDLILSAAAAHDDLGALFLIGQVPVPYSGKIAPDDHDDHLGAWPADLYYAELDGPWTDEEVDWSPDGINPRNHNIPGDGKFDQSTLPSDVDLIMGRVDLSNLIVFPSSELELLRSYLDRDHAFRTGQLSFERKAVIDENFPWFDHESAVYRSCIPMFGTADVYEAPFIETLSSESPLWSMAGGPGSYSSASGIGNSQDLADTPLNGAFAHVLGSYFGDWDTQNNFMRSVLASGSMLGVVWGLQEMVFHQMALGMPIGESIRQSQNARYSHYERHGRLVNVALMGDPTLTLFPVLQVDDLQLENIGPGVALDWSTVNDDVLGYHIYRRSDPGEHFVRINEQLIGTNSFMDPAPPVGDLQYMVRALKLEQTASGTYHVLSTGKIAELTISVGISPSAILKDLTVFPSPNQGTFTVRSSELATDTEVRMFHVSGEEVAVRTTRMEGEFILTTEAVAGMYMLHLRTPSGDLLRRTVAITR